MNRPTIPQVGLLIAALTVGIGVIGLQCAGAPAGASPPPAPPAHAGPGTPILVELFTSEGCSSCPSADATVARLARDQPVAGSRVVVLAHHVDYWNQLGWPDPFSSADANARQRSYAILGGGSYTPEAVIDGRQELVGSRGGGIEAAVASAARSPHATLALEVAPIDNARRAFDITVRSSAIPAGAASDLELLTAVVQDRARVTVPRGENAGRTLDHIAIARSVRRVGGTGTVVKTRLDVPPVIDAPDGTTFSVIVFAQEAKSRRVVATASAALPTP